MVVLRVVFRERRDIILVLVLVLGSFWSLFLQCDISSNAVGLVRLRLRPSEQLPSRCTCFAKRLCIKSKFLAPEKTKY